MYTRLDSPLSFFVKLIFTQNIEFSGYNDYIEAD